MHNIFRSIVNWYLEGRARRYARFLREAAERRARARVLPRHEFAHQGGRLDKVRFLRREYMFLEWTSWVSALREQPVLDERSKHGRDRGGPY